MKLPFFLSSLILVLSCFSIANAQSEQQNVIASEFPDPSIIEVEGVYYACGSSNNWGPIYPIYKSTDLKNWTFVNYVFQEPPAWTISSYWAPELFYHNGTFYCYYTARRSDGVSCIGVATTNNIEEGFTDKGQLIEWGNEAIDAFVYHEEDKLYISWKAYGLTPNKPIQILGSELTADGLALEGDHFEMLTAEADSWEEGGIEGQSIVKNNGYLYMLYSGNACCGGSCDYKVGVARAKTMTGPWEKFDGNPLLESNKTWKCPGHGTALKTNNEWYYLYHAYHNEGFPYLGRTALLNQLYWKEDTDWPYFKVETDNIDPTVLKKNISDDFSSETLENWWHYDIPNYQLTTKLEDNRLTLYEEKRSENNHTGSALVVIPLAADFSMTTKVTGRNEALKGLVFYATSANSLGLGVKGKDLILWKVKDEQFVVLNKITLDESQDIYLSANVSEGHIIAFQYSSDGESWNQILNPQSNTEQVIGDNLAWWSWGMKCGLFVKTDRETHINKAVFDNFSLEYK